MANSRQVTVVLSPMHFVDEFPERVLTLTPDSPLIKIGRSSKNTTKNYHSGPKNAFFDSPVMSREHAKLWMADHHLYIEDVGSMHGTFMDLKPLTKKVVYPLAHGAVVTFGCRVTRGADTFPARSFRIRYNWKDWRPPAPETLPPRTLFSVPEALSDDDMQESQLDDRDPPPAYSATDDLFVPTEQSTSPGLSIPRGGSVEVVSMAEFESVAAPGLEQGTSNEIVCSAVASRAIEVPESDTSLSQGSDSDLEICDGSDIWLNSKRNAGQITESVPQENKIGKVETYDQSKELLTLQDRSDRESSRLDGSKEHPLVIDEGVEMRQAELHSHDDDKPEKHPALSLSHVLISHDRPQISLEVDSPQTNPVGKGTENPDFNMVTTFPEICSSRGHEVSDDQVHGGTMFVDISNGSDLTHREERAQSLTEYNRRMSLAFLSCPRPAPSRDERMDSHLSKVTGANERRGSAADAVDGPDGCGLRPTLTPSFSEPAQEISSGFAPMLTQPISSCVHRKNILHTMRPLLGSKDAFTAPNPTEPANPDPSSITSPRKRSNDSPVSRQAKLSDIAQALRLPPEIASTSTANGNGGPLGNSMTRSNVSTVGSVGDKESRALERVLMQQELSDVVGCFDRNDLCLGPFTTSFDSMIEPLSRPVEGQMTFKSNWPDANHDTSLPRLPTMPQSAHVTLPEHPSVQIIGNHDGVIHTSNLNGSAVAAAQEYDPSPASHISETDKLSSAAPITSSLKRKATDEGPVLYDGEQYPSVRRVRRARLGCRDDQPRTDLLGPAYLISNKKELEPVETKSRSKWINKQDSASGPPPRKRVRIPESSTGWLATAKSTAKMVAGAAAAGFGVFAYLAVSNPDPI